MKTALIGELIPLGLMHVNELLQDEVRQLAGERYQRNGLPGHDRWGSQPGFVYLGGQRVPVMVPCVRNTEAGTEVPLTTYNHLRSPGATAEDRLYKSILYGLSCGNYRECSASGFIERITSKFDNI